MKLLEDIGKRWKCTKFCIVDHCIKNSVPFEAENMFNSWFATCLQFSTWWQHSAEFKQPTSNMSGGFVTLCERNCHPIDEKLRDFHVNHQYQIPTDVSPVFSSAFTCKLFSSFLSILRMSVLINDSTICYVNSVVTFRADEYSCQ